MGESKFCHNIMYFYVKAVLAAMRTLARVSGSKKEAVKNEFSSFTAAFIFFEQTFNKRSFSERPSSSANACYSITAPFADDATFLIYLESQPLVTFGGGAT